MKFSYQFTNLLGCPYRNGNIEFLPNGDCLGTPSGNLLTVFDLKKNISGVLPLQTSFNITRIAFSPNGCLAMAANDNNDLLSISMISRSLLRTYHLNAKINDIKWSPNGKIVAVSKGSEVIIYCSPNCVKDVNPFHAVRILRGSHDDVTSLCWSPDSLALAVGSREGATRVYACDQESNDTDFDENKNGDFRVLNLAWSRRNVRNCVIGGSSGPVVSVFFESDRVEKNEVISVDSSDLVETSNMNVYVITYYGQVYYWKKSEDYKEIEAENGSKRKLLIYKKAARYSYKRRSADGSTTDHNDSGISVDRTACVTTTAYHSSTRILCSGFSDGSLFLHEMPSFQLIHSLNVSDHPLSSIRFNSTGEWIAIASQQLGQLAVWEWRSEMFVMKQQSHFHATTAISISPDGRTLASGGDDSKIKLWDLASGHSFVTFSENNAGIVGLCWTQSGRAIVSASLDGTVRAFDVVRYRNFRTFTPPKQAQLSCVAVDESGEVIAAGSIDSFEIFVWSLPTGQLLDSLAGHEAPISAICFLPTPQAGILVSGSWDSSLRMWCIGDGSSADSRESLKLSSDVLKVATRSDGQFVAVATLDCQIAIVETESVKQVGNIEAKVDVGKARSVDDQITAKQKADASGQYFSSLRYSPDGEFLLAAGLSRFICIYSVKVPGEEILLKRFLISQNLSLDSNQQFLNRRFMTEKGHFNKMELDNDLDAESIPLPGVSRNDPSLRKFKHAVQVWDLDFNPGGDNFVAASSEGLLVYSANSDMTFDPIDLDVDMTVENAETFANEGDLSRAIIIGLKLRNRDLLSRSLERVRDKDISVVINNLPFALFADLVVFVASKIETPGDSSGEGQVEIELFLKWADALLLAHAAKFSSYTSASLPIGKVSPSLTLLQRAISSRMRTLGQLCDYVNYTVRYATSMSSSLLQEK